MQNLRTPALVAVVLLLAIAAGAFWLLDSSAGEPTAPPQDVPVPAAAPAPVPEVATGVAPEVVPEAARTLAPIAASAAANGPALVGVVVGEDGRPIAGATVTTGITSLFSPRSFQAEDFDIENAARVAERMRERLARRIEVTTAADGKFRLVVDGEGAQVQIEARARAFQTANKFVARPTTVDVDVGALTLARGAVIGGRVVDEQGRGVASASVLRLPRGMAGGRGPGGGPGGGPGANGPFGGMNLLSGEVGDLMRGMLGDVLTDAEGRFELTDATPGEFALRVRHAEHPVATREGLTVAVGQMLTDLVVALERGAEIRGAVTGIPSGTADLRVVAARITPGNAPAAPAGAENMFAGMAAQFTEAMGDFALAAERSALLGGDGSFTLFGLSVGVRYRVWVTQGGRGFLDNSVCSERLEVAAGASGVELHYDPGVAVRALVVDAKSGAPVEALVVRHRFDSSGNTGGLGDLAAMAQGMVGRGARVRQFPGGVVTIPSLRPKAEQTLRVTIEAIGHRRFEQRDIALPESGTLDLGTLQLEPAPVLQVTVRNKRGTPVEGASVRLRGENPAPGGAGDIAARIEAFAGGRGGRGGNPFGAMAGGGIGTQKTDDRGRAVLNALLDGPFTVSVDDAAFAPYRSASLQPPTGAAQEHAVTLLVGGSAAIVAVDSDGKPIANARIDHETPSGDNDRKTGDGNGAALFEHLEPGVHKFRLGSSGGNAAEGLRALRGGRRGGRGGAADGANEVPWVTAEVRDEAKVELTLGKSATARLSGLVRENGKMVAGARVQFVAGTGDEAPAAPTGDAIADLAQRFGGGGLGGNAARTDADGRYQLDELQAGQHRVRVTVDGRSMPTVTSVFLRLGDNVLDVDLASASLRGVVSGPDGKPVSGASVRVGPAGEVGSGLEGIMQNLPFGERGDRGGRGGRGGNAGGGVTTDAAGRFELSGVQIGVPLVVHAQAKGFAGGESAPVTVTAGSAGADVEVRLLAGGTVRVTTTTNQPFGVVIATFEAADGSKLAPVFGVLRNGSATLEGLRPGSWRIASRAGFGGQGGGDANAGQLVQVTAGQTIDVTL